MLDSVNSLYGGTAILARTDPRPNGQQDFTLTPYLLFFSSRSRVRERRWAVWETRLRVFQAAVGAFLASTAASLSTASVVGGRRALAQSIALARV